VTPSRYVVDATRSDARKAALAASLAAGQEIFRTHRDLYRLLVQRDPAWGWWSVAEVAVLVLAIFALLAALARMADRRESVVLDARGVLVRDHSDEIVPWAAIKRIWPDGDRRVCLTLLDPSRSPPHGWRRWLALRRPKGADISMAVQGKPERREALLKAFDAWRPALVGGL